MPAPPQWLEWVRRLQSVAQSGLEYGKDPYDRQRYDEIRRLAADIAAKSEGLPDVQPVLSLFKNEIGYATPKVDIRIAVFDRGRVLLVRERSDGLWTLPGGWADVGESPAVVAIREVKEESGYEIVIKKLAAVLDRENMAIRRLPTMSINCFSLVNFAEGKLPKALKQTASNFSARTNFLHFR